MPKEHGSWSLAFEPVALGLLAVPSVGGAWFAAAVAAGFFARRPLRIAVGDPSPSRRALARSALLACAAVAILAVAMAMREAGASRLVWVVPSLVGGGFFLVHDLRNAGREEAAELAGTAAFAWLPAGFVALAVRTGSEAVALAAVMLLRAVPTVIFVRTMVRNRKSGRTGCGGAFAVGMAAAGLGWGLVLVGAAPTLCAGWGVILLARIAIIARFPATRPKILGMIEAVVGAAFVISVGLSWR